MPTYIQESKKYFCLPRNSFSMLSLVSTSLIASFAFGAAPGTSADAKIHSNYYLYKLVKH